MELNFNIVYTVGTVRYLRLLVFSLLKWSEASFRLVANGCSPQEAHMLEELCRSSSQLEFLALPSTTLLPHSDVLSHLQSMEQSQYFCFMDSDILATGDFVSEMAPYLGQYSAVFSATPIWCTEEEQVLPDILPRMPGHFNRTSDGVCLGSTYFAIYDKRVLSELIESTGIGFGRYAWDEIPASCQAQINQIGLRKLHYDTGKLLNVVLNAQGKQLKYVDSAFLRHIGGVSARAALERGLNPRGRSRTRAPWPVVRIKRWFARAARIEAGGREKIEATEAERREYFARRRRRWPAARYFSELFAALFDDRPLPPVPKIGDRQIEGRIEAVGREVAALYGEFGERLR